MIEINETFPLYIAANITELKDFYTTFFGFTPVFFEPDFYLHLLHPASGNQIGFLMPDHPSQPAYLHAATSNTGIVLTFDVTNAKAAFEQANIDGLDIVLQYTEESWGQNHFIIRDPQGLLIDLVEHTE